MEFSRPWLGISSIFLAILLFATWAACDPNAPCYYPGGSVALLYLPCDPFAYTTMCCPLGYTCFSTSLCVMTNENATTVDAPIGTTLRPTCTNPLWNDTACGDFCLDTADSGALSSCGDDKYCCRSKEVNGACNCSSGEGTFSVDSGKPLTIVGVTGSQNATLPPRTRTSSSSSDPTSMAFSSTVITVFVTATPSNIASPSATPTSAPSQSEDVTKTTRFKVGVGVGSAIAFCLLLALIFFCFRKPIQRKMEGVRHKQQIHAWQPQMNPIFGADMAALEASSRPSGQSTRSNPWLQVVPMGQDPNGGDGDSAAASDTSPARSNISPASLSRSPNSPSLGRLSPGPLSSNPYIPPRPQERLARTAALRPVSEVTEPRSNASSPSSPERTER